MANSIFKSHIFRQQKPLEQLLWRLAINSNDASLLCAGRRFSLLHLVLLPRPSHILYHSLPLRHCSILPTLPVLPLRRRRLSPVISPMSASLNSDATSDFKTVRMVIKGRVQGVFYRDWTVENAKELALKGWVRNRRDGSVEALFSGSSEKVEEMEQRCRSGPPAAVVTGLQVFPCSDDPGTSFERKPYTCKALAKTDSKSSDKSQNSQPATAPEFYSGEREQALLTSTQSAI